MKTVELTAKTWPAFEKLFGDNGACAGGWCMWWRLQPSERIAIANGPAMKQRQKALVLKGESRGVLAFLDGEPVGWCASAPRKNLYNLNRSKALACDDADQIWSVPPTPRLSRARCRSSSRGLRHLDEAAARTAARPQEARRSASPELARLLSGAQGPETPATRQGAS